MVINGGEGRFKNSRTKDFHIDFWISEGGTTEMKNLFVPIILI